MPSIKDISAQCGVSTATVSKALNDAPDVSEATKQRIRAVAEQLGYRPNAMARALKTKRTMNIGILFKEEANRGLTHEYFAAILESFKNEAERRGYDIIFINTANGSMSFLEHCQYQNVDGVAIICAHFMSPEILELVDSKIPLVSIDFLFNDHMAVLSDNMKGITDLLEYAFTQGHRKIAYIHGAPSFVSDVRLRSFYAGAQKLGLRVPQEYVKAGIFHDTESCAAMTAQLLDLPEPPTCIMMPDDFSAIGGLQEIKRRGLQIPRDISVMAFDGIPLSQVLDPPLTTLHQDTEAVGRTAAQQLIDQIEDPRSTIPYSTTIAGVLWEGGSVGPVKP